MTTTTEEQKAGDALSDAETQAAMRFAMDALRRMPKATPAEREAHLTGMLIVFWGALWGTMGTEFAKGFIEAQLRGMEPGMPHERFQPPRVQ